MTALLAVLCVVLFAAALAVIVLVRAIGRERPEPVVAPERAGCGRCYGRAVVTVDH